MVLFTGCFFLSARRAERDEFSIRSPSRHVHNAFQFPSLRKRRLKLEKTAISGTLRC